MARMSRGQKNFHKYFAPVSLGFVLLFPSLPSVNAANHSTNSSVKREAASAQFSRAEDQRAAFNSKAPEKRTLAEYKQVVSSYFRVHLITPHAAEVPDSLVAVSELYTEMGDRFGKSYYQQAADNYAFLIKEYPTSKYLQDAMLHMGQLQKDQLGDADAATKTFQAFQKKFPRSAHKREVQEALAELALMKGADGGPIPTKTPEEPAKVAAAPEKTAGAASARAAKQQAANDDEEEQPQARSTESAVHKGGASSRASQPPHVRLIRTKATADSTEVVIELEDTVQYSSGRIANPDRIYFDLHSARLSPQVAHGNVKVTGGLLTQVRVAQNQSGIVRVVLDVTGVQDYSASLLSKPARLLIELYPAETPATAPVQTAKAKPEKKAAEPVNDATPDEQVAAVTPGVESEPKPVAKAPAQQKPAPPPEPSVKQVVAQVTPTDTQPVPAPTPAAVKSTTPAPVKNLPLAKTNGKKPDLITTAPTPQPTRDGQSTLTRALGLKISRIVIDAGHGGHDTGTIGPTGLMEKDLCLDVALRLGKLIEQKLPGADIIYTRSDDTFIPLEERTHIANESKADLFISIHANSSPDHGARGVETYYLNLKGSQEAMEVAARENAVGQQNIHELEDLVKKIARTEKIDESKEFAEDVQDSLSKRIQKTAKPVKNRGVRKAPFVVLIGADMPSILTEISFLSNPADEQLLKKPEHRQRIAEGVFQGVSSYLQSLNSVNVNLNTAPKRATAPSKVEQSRNQN